MAKLVTEEARRLHKKFIPVNIVIIIISIIAGICQLFMPALDLRIHITGAKLAPVLEESIKQDASSESGSMATMLTTVLNDVEIELPINIYPMKLLAAATGDEQDIAAFMNSIVGKDGPQALVNEMMSELTPALLTVGISTMLSESGLPAEQVEQYKQDISQVLTHLEAGNKDAARENFNSITKGMIEAEGGTFDADAQAESDEMFEKFYQSATDANGKLDYSKLIASLGDLSNFGIGESSTPAEEQTPNENANVLLSETTTSESSSDSPISGVTDLLQNPGGMILDLFKDMGLETEQLQTVLLIMFLLFAGIPAALWFCLAFFSLIRCFMKKKKATMFFVKMFCIWPGLIVLLGNIAMKVLPSALSNVAGGAAATSILGAFNVRFLGSGIVTGICYLLLVFITLFWIRPIKRKIKRANEGDYDEDDE